MRTGWTLKDAAGVLGIHERRVTQSLDPTLERIARLWLADATRTMQAILERVEQLRVQHGQDEQQRQRAFEADLPARVARQCGGRLVEC